MSKKRINSDMEKAEKLPQKMVKAYDVAVSTDTLEKSTKRFTNPAGNRSYLVPAEKQENFRKIHKVDSKWKIS